jgi:excisionase family DNA binding protein
MMSELPFSIGVSLDMSTCQAIAEHLAERLTHGLRFEDVTESDRWLTSEEAGAYIGATRQRVSDLVYARKLIPDGRDGRSPRFKRSTLDAYLEDCR